MFYFVLVLCCSCVLLWWCWWWWRLLVVFMHCRSVLAGISCNGCWPIRENSNNDQHPLHQILCDRHVSHKNSNYIKFRLFFGDHNLGQMCPIFVYNIPFRNLQWNESKPQLFFTVSPMMKQKICLKLCVTDSCYDRFSDIHVKCIVYALYVF